MFEDFILTAGFRNLYKLGVITGFQFKIIIPYYRGIWISMMQDFVVKVDGVTCTSDQLSIKIGDKIIPYTDADKAYDIFWVYGEPATVIVNKPGGLEVGLHTIECGLYVDKSYWPWVDPEGLYSFYNIPRSVEGEPKDTTKALQMTSKEITLVV
jgi:hypothetical protein